MSVILDFPCRNKDESTEDYLTRVIAYTVLLEHKIRDFEYAKNSLDYSLYRLSKSIELIERELK